MEDDGDGGGGGDGGDGDVDGGGDRDVMVMAMVVVMMLLMVMLMVNLMLMPMVVAGLLEHPVLCSLRVLRNEFSIWLGYIVLSRILQITHQIGSLGGSEGKGMAFPSVT